MNIVDVRCDPGLELRYCENRDGFWLPISTGNQIQVIRCDSKLSTILCLQIIFDGVLHILIDLRIQAYPDGLLAWQLGVVAGHDLQIDKIERLDQVPHISDGNGFFRAKLNICAA